MSIYGGKSKDIKGIILYYSVSVGKYSVGQGKPHHYTFTGRNLNGHVWVDYNELHDISVVPLLDYYTGVKL